MNVSSLSDEIICDKAPHVDFYPELKVFYNEAKVRGLDCIENVVPLEVGQKAVKVQSDFKPKK